jgi:2-methylcitrate dehydratase PrpD
MAYCLAVAVVYGRLDPADFSDEILHDPRVKALIEKVHHRPGMKTLQFILRTGETMTEPILPGNDLHTWDAVVEKFRRSTNRSLTETQQSMVIDAVSRLEELSSVSMLTKSLQTP